MIVLLKYYLLIYATTSVSSEIVSSEPPADVVATPGNSSLKMATNTNKNTVDIVYRVVNRDTGATCILLKSDALIAVNLWLLGFEMVVDSFIPYVGEAVVVDGNCDYEDASSMTISWPGYKLLLNFTKMPRKEIWYMNNVELTINSEKDNFHGVSTHGKPIRLYREGFLTPTPIGYSYTCKNVTIDLETNKNDHPPSDFRGGTLHLRILQMQPFMDKDDFGAPFECRPEKVHDIDGAPPVAVGSVLAIGLSVAVIFLNMKLCI